MPKISYDMRHAPGATFPHPLELEWIGARRALLPERVKEWMAEKEAGATERATRVAQPAPRASPIPTLTPEEKRARKLQQTRESNARKRIERKATGLPHK